MKISFVYDDLDGCTYNTFIFSGCGDAITAPTSSTDGRNRPATTHGRQAGRIRGVHAFAKSRCRTVANEINHTGASM